MGKLTYREQLMHPNWQRKRLEVMESAGFSCEDCGTTDVTLNIHHKRYVKGRMAWDYERLELQCLCQPCHERQHKTRDLLERLLMHPDMSDLVAIGLIGGYLEAACCLDEDLYAECVRASGDAILYGAIAEIVRPNRNVTWAQIADAIESLYRAPNELNPAESLLLLRAREWSDEERLGWQKEAGCDA